MSFKCGYMRKETPARRVADSGEGQAAKRGGAELLIQSTHSHNSIQFFGHSAIGAVQQLDRPASRDQINDRNNQGDHQQEMNQAAGHVESPA